jgi:hypothetical protein
MTTLLQNTPVRWAPWRLKRGGQRMAAGGAVVRVVIVNCAFIFNPWPIRPSGTRACRCKSVTCRAHPPSPGPTSPLSCALSVSALPGWPRPRPPPVTSSAYDCAGLITPSPGYIARLTDLVSDMRVRRATLAGLRWPGRPVPPSSAPPFANEGRDDGLMGGG